MPTKDGKRPLSTEIDAASNELEIKINQLIHEFKEVYNEPAITFLDGDEYSVRLNIDLGLLREQYNNTSL